MASVAGGLYSKAVLIGMLLGCILQGWYCRQSFAAGIDVAQYVSTSRELKRS
jgi:hypothetical protein